MLAPSHLVVGAAVGLVFIHYVGVIPTPPEVLLLLAGSLAPDIDGNGSITRPSKWFGGAVPKLFRNVIDRSGSALSGVVRGTFGHRGFFHWPLVGALLMYAAFSVHISWLFWFALGYVSHIAADFLTVGGIPVFAPIISRNFSAKLFRTGSLIELLFIGILIAAGAYLGFASLPSQLRHQLRSFIL